MKCNDCLLSLEEYFDGELDEKQSQTIETHLFICMNCSKAYRALEQEQKAYNNYERNLIISPTLALSIQAKLKEQLEQKPKPQPKFSWIKNLVKVLFSRPNLAPVFVAASLILVTVVTTIMVMKNFSKIELEKSPITNVAPSPMLEKPVEKEVTNNLEENLPLNLESLPAPKINSSPRKLNKTSPAQKLIKEAEGKYLAAITILEKDSKKNYQKMSPELKASFDKSLRIIDENIAQTRRAIEKNPKDPVVAQYMLAAYAKKVEILQEITYLEENFGD